MLTDVEGVRRGLARGRGIVTPEGGDEHMAQITVYTNVG
jgi:hypothetical protein